MISLCPRSCESDPDGLPSEEEELELVEPPDSDPRPDPRTHPEFWTE